MTNIDVKVRIKDLMDYSESLRSTIEEETLLMIIESFSQYLRRLYGLLVEEAIYSKRYQGEWEPVKEEGYIEYLGVEPDSNIIFSIEAALESVKIGNNYIIRINPRYRYPGSKIPLVRVLRAIEDGTSDFNARPIFKDIAVTMRKNIHKLWKGFLKMKGVI